MKKHPLSFKSFVATQKCTKDKGSMDGSRKENKTFEAIVNWLYRKTFNIIEVSQMFSSLLAQDSYIGKRSG